MTLSSQQQDVLNWVDHGTGSLNLVARAGCGKTTTLIQLVLFVVELARRAGKSIEIFLGAYNKAIAREVVAKLAGLGVPQRTCFASTMHGVGYNGWRRKAPNVQNENKKVPNLCYQMADAEPQSDLAADLNYFGEAIPKAVSFAKQRAFGVLCAIEDRHKWFDIIDHFGMEEDLPDDPNADLERFVDLCIMVYKKSLDQCFKIIDFDDMILAPLYFKVFMYPKDYVLIDEAQDTNPARRALALKILKPKTGRLIAVGDPAQAIYGFTGADADSMELIRKALNSSTLPLNKTFRCPQAVVRLAQTWVPDIEAADTNPEGLVRSVVLTGPRQGEPTPAQIFWNEQFQKEDAILCRNTRPLVELAYNFLRRGIACQVEGREIGQGLIKLIRRWKATKLTALLPKVEEYKAREIQKYLAKGKEDRAAAIEDQCETVLVLAGKIQEEGKTLVQDLVDFINSIFGDTPDGDLYDQRDANGNITSRATGQKVLTLCTIHKSKGREWNRVYLVGRNKFMPSKYARKDWQVEQERNLCYVAVTRAKAELVEVTVN